MTRNENIDLQAHARITDLIYRYARIVRTGNTEACGELFTDDATFEVREAIAGNPASLQSRSRVAGREDIVKYVARSASAGGVCPLIHNLLIDVEGDNATCNSVMTAMVWASGKMMFGEYHDGVRYDGAWRFTSRIYTIMRAPDPAT